MVMNWNLFDSCYGLVEMLPRCATLGFYRKNVEAFKLYREVGGPMPEIPTIASKPLPMRAVANLLEISHSQWYEIVQPRCSFAIVDQRSADPSVAPVPAFTLKHKSCFSLGDMLDGNVTIFAEDKPLKSARIPLDYAMGLVRCSRALPLREQKFKGKTH